MLIGIGLLVALRANVLDADTTRIAGVEHLRYEFRVSTFTPSAQEQVALALAPDARGAAVWASRRQESGDYGIYAQRFDADGRALGRETRVNVWTQDQQSSPAIAPDGDAGFWIVWQSWRQDGHRGAVIARHFDSELRGGNELCVNVASPDDPAAGLGDQYEPAVCVSPHRAALFTWTSQPPGNAAARVFARLIAPDGTPLGAPFAIAPSRPDRSESLASAAFAADGSFAVVYAVRTAAAGDPLGIRLRRFDAAGRPLGDEIDVCGARRQSPIEPTIAALPGGYLLAWLDAESDGDDYGVLARRFDAAGNPLGDPFVVNESSTGPQNAAALAVAPDGEFVVAWNSSDGDKAGVFARRFAADGSPLTGEFRLTRALAGRQTLRPAAGTTRIALAADGRLVAAWNGDAGWSDSNSANVTILSPRKLADCRRGVTPEMIRALADARASDAPQLTADPHRPPTFDPRDIDYAEREFAATAEGDVGFTAIVNTGWTPPDPHMAVGPDHVVVMTNGAIAFFTKAGALDFQDQIEGAGGFWGEKGATGFVFDPEVLYDELSGRFFAMAAEAFAPGNKSYVLIAVSDDSNPNGTWYKYRFETTGTSGDLFDSPNIGVDANVVYITGDGFPSGPATYPVYTFDKPSLLAGNPPATQKQVLLSTSTQSAGIPPVSYNNPPALYLIEHKEASSNTSVRLIALTNPLGTPTFTTFTLTVPTYGPPEDAPQKGTSVRPESFDARFWSVAYRKGYLWATHHVNASRVRARWYQIAMNGWPTSGQNPSLVQSGEIDPGGTVRTFFSSITVAPSGRAAMTFAHSSPTEFISMATAFRYADDPPGTFQPLVIRKTSTAGDSSGRWGDYSSVQVDPNHLTFWAHHEYSVGGSWRTWVQGFTPPLVPGDANCDGSINGQDIAAFVLAMTNPAEYANQYPDCSLSQADMNDDGSVNGQDIEGFVAALGG